MRQANVLNFVSPAISSPRDEAREIVPDQRRFNEIRSQPGTAPPDSGFELRHLRYFVAVAEELHFGRAARALNISQPPLSRQIQDLERNVGARLLNRTGRSVALTEAGTWFLAESKRILAQVYHSVETIRTAAAGGPALRESGGEENCEENQGLVGDGTALRKIRQLIEVVAPTDATVLISGETGTGKELVARAIHQASPRRNRPFVTLSCSALQKASPFEAAFGGTLFLDEVGDVPLELQPRLLRALQEVSAERLGGTPRVRVLAATSRNLPRMMGDKLFRSDLYYRLNVFPIVTPPLRGHPEDIPVLVRHFTRKWVAKVGRQILRISPGTMHALVSWRWPGNVRELENFIARSVILSIGSSLCAPLTEIRDRVRVRVLANTIAGQTPTSTAHIFPS